MSDLLQIHVPKTTYKAGDVVSGSVYICSKDGQERDVDIASLSIIFTGRSSPTRYWPRVPKYIQLFAHKKTLLARPMSLRIPSIGCEDQYSWPFTFSFPGDCSAIQIDSRYASPLSLFNSDHSQPLPPSLSAFSDDSNPRDAVSIVYELQATLLSSSSTGYHPTNCIKRLELNLYAPRNKEQPGLECTNKIQRIICQTSHLLPEEQRDGVKRPLRLRERLGLKSAPTDHLPKAVFDAKLQILSSAIIGEALPIFLYIDFDLGSSTIQTPPAVHLKKVAVWLREDTSMLVPKPGPVAGEKEQAGWTKASQFAAQDFDKEGPLVSGFLDLRKIMDLTLKDDLVPTFKTFNIARSYHSKVNVTLECAGKTSFIYGSYNSCTLLAKQFDPDVPQYAQPVTPAVMTNEIDDPPPPYETVEQPPPPSQSSHASQHSRRRNGRRLAALQNMPYGGGSGGGGGASAGASASGGGGC